MSDILYRIKKAYMAVIGWLIKHLVFHYYKLDKTLLSYSFGLDVDTEFDILVKHYYGTYFTVGTKVITLEKLEPDEESRTIQPFILHYEKNNDRIANKLEVTDEELESQTDSQTS